MKFTNSKNINIVCIVSGLICVLFVALFMWSVKSEADSTRNEAMARYGGEQIEVCVAKKDIAAGETIDSASIEKKLWLADLLPDDSVRNSNEIIGKQVTSSILSGEVISSKRFQESNVSIDVPAGMTAVSVPAKDVSSVGGAINAGMHIDVYSTGNISTSLIAHNVLVLATSTTFNESSKSSSVAWITLAVNEESVQEIVAASQTTTLYFALPSDDSANEESTSKSNNVSGYESSTDTKSDYKNAYSDEWRDDE